MAAGGLVRRVLGGLVVGEGWRVRRWVMLRSLVGIGTRGLLGRCSRLRLFL